jgi:hypothetical protein
MEQLTRHDLHKGTDGAVSMWKLADKLQSDAVNQEIRRWIRSMTPKEE